MFRNRCWAKSMRVRSLAYFRAVTLEAFDLEWYVLVDLSGSNREVTSVGKWVYENWLWRGARPGYARTYAERVKGIYRVRGA